VFGTRARGGSKFWYELQFYINNFDPILSYNNYYTLFYWFSKHFYSSRRKTSFNYHIKYYLKRIEEGEANVHPSRPANQATEPNVTNTKYKINKWQVPTRRDRLVKYIIIILCRKSKRDRVELHDLRHCIIVMSNFEFVLPYTRYRVYRWFPLGFPLVLVTTIVGT